MRCGDFMLWDLKLRPAKDRAAARGFADVLDVPPVLVDRPETVVDGALSVEEDCLLWTESCRLLAKAFSCWRMN